MYIVHEYGKKFSIQLSTIGKWYNEQTTLTILQCLLLNSSKCCTIFTGRLTTTQTGLICIFPCINNHRGRLESGDIHTWMVL